MIPRGSRTAKRFNTRLKGTRLMHHSCRTLPSICALLVLVLPLQAADQPGVVSRTFIYDEAPFPQCHASTIAETPQGLVAAWFGGTHEKHPDVGIWVARHAAGHWTTPVEVANGIQYSTPAGDVYRHPTWNPVLFQYPDGPLVLFWKCGPSPSTWWGMMAESSDHGETWHAVRRLPEHIDGPVRNKPLLLEDGTLLSGSSTEFDGWRVHFEMSSDRGHTWQRTPAIHDGKEFGAIQPTILQPGEGKLLALCRNQDGNGQILETTSEDGGKTWTTPAPGMLPNPNSGIDGVTLASGTHLLVYNHTHRGKGNPRGRAMINLAVSDDGVHWQAALTLDREERSEFSYPAIIQTSDGLVHITYTWKRTRVRHTVVDPAKLQPQPFTSAEWPLP